MQIPHLVLIEIGAHAGFVVAVLGRLQIGHQHHLVKTNVALGQKIRDRCLNAF